MRCTELVAAVALSLATFTDASHAGAQSVSACAASPCPLMVQKRLLGYAITEGVTGRRVARFTVLAPPVDIFGGRSAVAAAEYGAFRRGWNRGFALSQAGALLVVVGGFMVLDGRESGTVVVGASVLALVQGSILQRRALPRLYRSVQTYNATLDGPSAARRP